MNTFHKLQSIQHLEDPRHSTQRNRSLLLKRIDDRDGDSSYSSESQAYAKPEPVPLSKVVAVKQWNDGKIDGSEGLGGLRDVGVEVVVEWIGVVWREWLVDGNDSESEDLKESTYEAVCLRIEENT